MRTVEMSFFPETVTAMREPAPSLTLPPRETRKDSISTNLMFALVGLAK